jgi:Domain of unknown function (DUF4410)
MICSRFRIPVLALVFILPLAGCFGAYQVKPDHPAGAGPLKPTIRDRDAGLVGIASGFDLKTFQVIAVELFSVTDPAIKSEEDRQLASLMEAFFQAELVRRLRECGLFEHVINLSETEWRPDGEKALILGGRITRLGEGSQALRALFGVTGVGKARAQAEMTFVDVQTGRPVMVTADRRVAQMGLLGGDSKDQLKEFFDDMARDLERFLVRLNEGKAPKKG